MTIAGSPGSSRRTRCTSSAPPISGMRMSETSASKRVCSASASASRPLPAVTTSSPASRTISARLSANAWLSSTMRYLRMLLQRQPHREARASALPRLVADGPAVPLDDAFDQRQAEADALHLGGDQRLEQPRADRRVEPGAVVLDGERDRVGRGAADHLDLAAVADRVHRVVDQ